MKRRVLIICTVASLITPLFADDDGFGFDDLEQIEASEQQELLQMAKEKAKAYDFSRAKDLIEQAENKAYSPDDIASAKKVLANAKAKKQKEDEEKARLARLAEEKRQRELVRRQSSSSSSSSGGGYVNSVIVEGKAISGLFGTTYVKSINLSGGDGYYDKSNSLSSINIFKGYNGIAGTYGYTLRLTNGVDKVCSGSVYIDGKHKWVTINVYVDSCEGYVNQN